jgi:hypothetical protein
MMPRKASAKKTGDTPDDELQDLAKKAFANIFDFARVDSSGRRLEVFDLQKAADVGAVVSVRTRKIGRGKNAREVRATTITMPNKVKALEKLGKHMGLFSTEPPRPQAAVRSVMSGLHRLAPPRAARRGRSGRRAARSRETQAEHSWRRTQQSQAQSECEDEVMAFPRSQVKQFEAQLNGRHMRTREADGAAPSPIWRAGTS